MRSPTSSTHLALLDKSNTLMFSSDGRTSVWNATGLLSTPGRGSAPHSDPVLGFLHCQIVLTIYWQFLYILYWLFDNLTSQPSSLSWKAKLKSLTLLGWKFISFLTKNHSKTNNENTREVDIKRAIGNRIHIDNSQAIVFVKQLKKSVHNCNILEN